MSEEERQAEEVEEKWEDPLLGPEFDIDKEARIIAAAGTGKPDEEYEKLLAGGFTEIDE